MSQVIGDNLAELDARPCRHPPLKPAWSSPPCSSTTRPRGGRTHKGTHVILLIQDLDLRVVNAVTGELLRELTIDTSKDYQPRTPK
ncbi:hypothetical protein ABLE68_04230 [Nocardioides sp. CN2-186]|uniref:hypothetical protein n=1 Tax=Nocardioides tweenelious TaxID=3156607 RepID=UPI0032B337E6